MTNRSPGPAPRVGKDLDDAVDQLGPASHWTGVGCRQTSGRSRFGRAIGNDPGRPVGMGAMMRDPQNLVDYSESDLTVGHQKEYAAGVKAVAVSMKRAAGPHGIQAHRADAVEAESGRRLSTA